MTQGRRVRRIVVGALAAVAGILLLAGRGDAGVNLKNGNFYITYVDIAHEGPRAPQIERTYNSKSSITGLFGFGWGSEYETALEVSGDGSVVLRYYGGGATDYFYPPALSSTELDAAVERMALARGAQPGVSQDSVMSFRAGVRRSAELRTREWTRLVRSGVVPRRELAVGVRLRTRTGYEMLRTRDGYSVDGRDGNQLSFDTDGRLTEIRDRAGNWTALAYDSVGKPRTLRDHRGQAIALTVDDRGLVTSATDNAGRKATYEYDARDNLVRSVDAARNEYGYSYDANHNLTRIRYSDGTSLEVEYDPRTQFARRVTDRRGGTTLYEYWTNPADSLHYSTTTVQLSAPRRVAGVEVRDTLARNSYEYVIGQKADGQRWTRRIVTVVNGVRTETDYTEREQSLRIVRGRDTTNFEYDRAGRRTRRETPAALDSTVFDAVSGKTTRIVALDKRSGVRRWTTYEYDATGNVSIARDSERGELRFSRDERGNVTAIAWNDVVVRMTYAAADKPAVVEHSKAGKLTIRYDANGKIESVDSDPKGAASDIAAQVRDLMSVLTAAGERSIF